MALESLAKATLSGFASAHFILRLYSGEIRQSTKYNRNPYQQHVRQTHYILPLSYVYKYGTMRYGNVYNCTHAYVHMCTLCLQRRVIWRQ